MGGTPVFNAGTHSGAITVGDFISFSGSKDGMSVTDETGTNSGWKFSVAMTDFHTSGIDDPTDGASADMDIFIAAGDWMSINIDNSSQGMDEDGTYTLIPGIGGDGGVVEADKVLFFGGMLPIGTPNCSEVTANTMNLITVDPGYGAGRYVFDLNLKILIDGWLPVGARVNSTASAGGRFDDMTIGAGDKVQVFAGVYSADMTYSASCNPAS
ncbi:MAG: hypothetical protein JXB33_09725, partial [Clostridia bacterium]|nr:hypothetical protein [Clostridia bacterium]